MSVKRWRGFIFTFVMAASGPAAADDFDDFRIPAHDLIDWRAQLGLDAAQMFQGVSTAEQRNRAFRASLGSGFAWLSDSDPMTTELALSVEGAGHGNWAHQSANPTPSFSQSTDNETRLGREDWNATFAHRRYPTRAIGIELSVFGAGTYAQQWTDNRADGRQIIAGSAFRDVSRNSSEEWDYSTIVSTRLMIGLGRVRDASSIYEARVLEDRLRETGGLTQPLSAAGRQKLAALLSTRFRYEFFRERPTRSLWDRIEDVLREDGALAEGGLRADVVLRAGEPHTGPGLMSDVVPRSPVLRRVGFFAGPTLLDQHASYVTRFDGSSFSQRSVDDSLSTPIVYSPSFHQHATADQTFLGARGEYHRPLGPSWQGDISGDAVFPMREGIGGTLASAEGRLSWMIADHWEASGFADYQRLLLQDQTSTLDDRWSWIYGLSATWYIQDQLQLTVFAREQQMHQQIPSFFSPAGATYTRAGSISLALTYRILGGFGAPGLIPHESL